MELFDEQWSAAAATVITALAVSDGVDAVLDHVIDGSPSGKVVVGVTVEDGKVTAITSGRSGDPDVVVAMTYETARKILSGELSSDAAYMNGALKVEGAHERWMLDLRPLRVAAVDALAPLMAATRDGTGA